MTSDTAGPPAFTWTSMLHRPSATAPSTTTALTAFTPRQTVTPPSPAARFLPTDRMEFTPPTRIATSTQAAQPSVTTAVPP